MQQVRREVLEYMIKIWQMVEFGSLQEAMSSGGKAPTTTKWVDRTNKDDDGKEFVRCRLWDDHKVKIDAQNPSPAAFATRSAASWQLRDEAVPRCRAPDEEGTGTLDECGAH